MPFSEGRIRAYFGDTIHQTRPAYSKAVAGRNVSSCIPTLATQGKVLAHRVTAWAFPRMQERAIFQFCLLKLTSWEKGGAFFNLSIHMNYLPRVRKGKLLFKERKNLRRVQIKNSQKLWREYAATTTLSIV